MSNGEWQIEQELPEDEKHQEMLNKRERDEEGILDADEALSKFLGKSKINIDTEPELEEIESPEPEFEEFE